MTSVTISTELRQVLRRLRPSPMLDTLPERLILAHQQHLPYHDFLELILSDELTRRERMSASLRARSARLDPSMTLKAWDDTAAVTFDRQLWAELATLRFVEASNTTCSSWDRSAWARRCSPMPSAISPAGVVTP